MTIHPKDSDIAIPYNARNNRATSFDYNREMTLSWLQIQAMSSQSSNIQPQPIPQVLVSLPLNREHITQLPTGILRKNVRMCRVTHSLTVHRHLGKRALCEILEEALNISADIINVASESTFSPVDEKSKGKDVITNTNDIKDEDLSAATMSNTK